MQFPDVPITEKEREAANQEALRIFGELRKKYCNDSVEHLDIILNSLVFSLIRMARTYVSREDRKNFMNLVYQIMTKELLDANKTNNQ